MLNIFHIPANASRGRLAVKTVQRYYFLSDYNGRTMKKLDLNIKQTVFSVCTYRK